MQRIKTILAMALLALLLCAGSAFAQPTLGPGFNFITFTNFENRIPVEGDNDLILPGDIFYGIARIDAIDWASTPVSPDWIPTLNTQYLQGYFFTQVASVTPVNDDQVIIIFETPTVSDPYGVISDADLAQGVVLKWFESNTPLMFTSEAASVASATDGSLWLSLSIEDGYWWSLALPSAAGLGANTLVADSFYGLNAVDGSASSGLIQINDPIEDLFDLDVNFYGQAKVFTSDPNNPTGAFWEFYSSDPAVVATPEPGTLLILGSGLLGLAASRRRRNKA
ncbi:PEP motif putative anchor domain protein [Alkalidesulfovibrio alkalitolerans DSM 16529]|jgi:hypothetical protein|uniref:PEP motif putative anchor domain protein n=1 Tax=Alkalidesulfovibrio alkalitolerans DSM 16529 TaxID=1121439 RepID=S7U9B2_9BACT|nr:PEP-CTERM sorting domain-containing protein [Alkalidesulfovibrio alkalitolerans]EPR30544.1 PEP motif putative anchor domain protein [Alkalidesulfovibrio alkalitolerans DSM 16529]